VARALSASTDPESAVRFLGSVDAPLAAAAATGSSGGNPPERKAKQTLRVETEGIGAAKWLGPRRRNANRTGLV